MLITEHPGLWQHFVNRADNRGLTTEQQRVKYLQEQLLFENFMSFQIQQRIIQQNISAGGTPGPAPTVTSNHIEFVIDTSDNYFGMGIQTSSEITATINWGDGQTEEIILDGNVSVNHSFDPSGEGVQYTVRMEFSDPTQVIRIEFNGND